MKQLKHDNIRSNVFGKTFFDEKDGLTMPHIYRLQIHLASLRSVLY